MARSFETRASLPKDWVEVMKEIAAENMRNSWQEWLREDVLRPIVIERLRERRESSSVHIRYDRGAK